jgi:hypothetical protein
VFILKGVAVVCFDRVLQVLILIDVARGFLAAKMTAFSDEEPADTCLLTVLEILRGDTIEEGSGTRTHQWFNQVLVL